MQAGSDLSEGLGRSWGNVFGLQQYSALFTNRTFLGGEAVLSINSVPDEIENHWNEGGDGLDVFP